MYARVMFMKHTEITFSGRCCKSAKLYYYCYYYFIIGGYHTDL